MIFDQDAKKIVNKSTRYVAKKRPKVQFIYIIKLFCKTIDHNIY